MRFNKLITAFLFIMMLSIFPIRSYATEKSIMDIKDGEYIKFSGYTWKKIPYYDSDTRDSYVTLNQNHNLYIFSEQSIKRRFHNEYILEWENSELRNWLNNDFYNSLDNKNWILIRNSDYLFLPVSFFISPDAMEVIKKYAEIEIKWNEAGGYYDRYYYTWLKRSSNELLYIAVINNDGGAKLPSSSNDIVISRVTFPIIQLKKEGIYIKSGTGTENDPYVLTDNIPPVITVKSPISHQSLGDNTNINFELNVNDKNNDRVMITGKINNVVKSAVVNGTGTATLTWNTAEIGEGKFTNIEFFADDGEAKSKVVWDKSIDIKYTLHKLKTQIETYIPDKSNEQRFIIVDSDDRIIDYNTANINLINKIKEVLEKKGIKLYFIGGDNAVTKKLSTYFE